MTDTFKIKFDYKPHPGQMAFHDSTARFRLIVAGTQGGKTTGGSFELAKTAITTTKKDPLFWIVAPTYQMLDNSQRAFLKWFEDEPNASLLREWRRKDRRATLINGARIECRSAEDPDYLRGPSVDGIWGDEASYLKEEAHRILRTRVTQTGGPIWYTTTPKGQRSWLYRFYKRCIDKRMKQFQAFQFPTSMNPSISAEEIEAARRELPESFFRQEYLAEFLEEGASPFAGIRNCMAIYDRSGSAFVIGYDPARRRDFAVGLVMNEHRQVVDLMRLHNTPWPTQRAKLKDMAQRWNTRVIAMDASASDPMSDDLEMAGLDVERIPFSLQRKEVLYRKLQTAIEGKELAIHPEYEVICEEAERMEYARSARGVTRYVTPPGFNDDCVAALALANHAATEHLVSQAPIMFDDNDLRVIEEEGRWGRFRDPDRDEERHESSLITRRWNFKSLIHKGVQSV